jgi:hypothetical protein
MIPVDEQNEKSPVKLSGVVVQRFFIADVGGRSSFPGTQLGEMRRTMARGYPGRWACLLALIFLDLPCLRLAHAFSCPFGKREKLL